MITILGVIGILIAAFVLGLLVAAFNQAVYGGNWWEDL